MDTIHDFKKSSFCGCGCGNCVGVAIEADAVYVTNTTAPGPVAKFTHDEWKLFVAGVKNSEFDLAA
jgi:hypothetical protein